MKMTRPSATPRHGKRPTFSRWIASSNFKRLVEDAGMLPEGTSEEAFCDAMTVVHSRTFSIPAKDRPSGAREAPNAWRRPLEPFGRCLTST